MHWNWATEPLFKKWLEIITISVVALPTRFDVKAMFVDREWRNSYHVKVRILCTCQMQNASIVIDVNADEWIARVNTRGKILKKMHEPRD